MKRQVTDWNKIFASHVSVSDEFVSRIYKKLLELNNKETNNPIFKKGKRFEKRRDMHWAPEKMYNIISHQKTHIKTTIGQHLTPRWLF